MELRSGGAPYVIGHRGAAALAPENSLAAIEAAAAAGVHGVELDVLRARDGSLVLAHGPELPPDAPPLADALRVAAELGLVVQLDIKLRGVEREVVDALAVAGLAERSFVSSFSLPALATFAALCPQLPRSLTYPEDRFGVSGNVLLRPLVRPGLATMRGLLPRRLPRWLRAVRASAATLNWTVVTGASVDACHRLGIAVYVWTVNDPDLVHSLVETGIDAIITDDPGVVLVA
jgi:glycerophosphoryl diester phosphodiesterase